METLENSASLFPSFLLYQGLMNAHNQEGCKLGYGVFDLARRTGLNWQAMTRLVGAAYGARLICVETWRLIDPLLTNYLLENATYISKRLLLFEV